MNHHLKTPLLFLFFIATYGFSEIDSPYPAGLIYPQGFMPATLDDKLLESEYERWKKDFVVECNGGFRVIGENSSETRVEGIGFGMIITAFCNKKEVFDGLYKFYKSKRTASANQMMAWQVSCNGINDQGSATDGDIDVAFALIAAGWQWGESYEEEAKEIIQILSENVIKTCSGDILALATGVSGGTAWGGCDMTDISYYNPAFFRVFADVSGDATWDKLADDTYTILNNGANPSTGLVPDWQSVSGSPGAGGREGRFRYDACRAPFRIALDYLWNNNEKAKAWCTKLTNWVSTIDPARIMDGYNLSGSASGSSNTSSFVGSFAVAAMCSSQETTDKICKRLNSLRDTRWFNISTRLCYLLALTGNIWKPDLLESSTRYQVNTHSSLLFVPSHRLNGRSFQIESRRGIRSIEIHNLAGKCLFRFKNHVSETIHFSIPENISGCVLLTARSVNGGSKPLRVVHLP